MNKYRDLISDIVRYGAMTQQLGNGRNDGLKRDCDIMLTKIKKAIKLMELEDQLREVAAPIRLKSSEVEELWMRTPYYMKPQAFAAAVQDAAGVP